MAFSDFEQKLLEPFVTSTTDPIYAVKHNVPPEVFGAFGSFFSRNPRDFRHHLLDALLGRMKGHENPFAEQELAWLAAGDFRQPSDALKAGVAKAQEFYETWYGKYSHKSIANVVWIPLVATNVSQLFARMLAYDQLAFFIEQSTRFVKFEPENFYRDPDVLQSAYADVYIATLTEMGKIYSDFLEEAKAFYRDQTPFARWRKQQTASLPEPPEREQKIKYNREINGQAFDVARFLLPQAIQTNIAWILDARSMEFDIAAWKGYPLAEIREAARLIEKHAGQIAPSLLKYTEINPYYTDNLQSYAGELPAVAPLHFEKSIDLVRYDADALNTVVAHLLKEHNRGGTFRQRYWEVCKLPFEKKREILQRITEHRGRHDEWVELEEAFDLAKVVFEIRSDIGAIRDWRRHQKFDRSEPLYTLDNGVHKPAIIGKMSSRAESLFDRSLSLAHEAEKKVRDDFPFAAQYVIPMAALHTITMAGGLDQVQYLLWTRTTPQGNFSYRQDAFTLAEVLVKAHPWLLGYESYPEGKPFLQLYREAPLKNLLRLQTADTTFHQ